MIYNINIIPTYEKYFSITSGYHFVTVQAI